MMRFILWNDVEQRDEGGAGVEAAAQLYPAPEGCSWHPIEGDLKTTTLALVEGELVEAARPLAIEAVKIARRAEVDALLSGFVGSTCPTPYGVIQCDQASREALQAKAIEAMLAQSTGAAFSTRWRLLDNGYSPEMDAAAMLAFSAGISAYFAACIAASFAAKDAIDACATAEDVAAIDIADGFPVAP